MQFNSYSKYLSPLDLIKSKSFNCSPKATDDRLVIFSERIETRKFLLEQLRKGLKLKDDQAYKYIGDPSVFMNVFDVQEEEKLTQQAMAEGKKAEDFDQQYQATEEKKNEGDALLAMFSCLYNKEITELENRDQSDKSYTL